MKRNSKQFLALFMAVAMSVTPVSYAYAEDSAVAGVENTESGQQTVEVTDGKIGAANAAGQPAEEVTGQEEETTAGQGTDENQKSQEEPKAEENAATGNVTEAEKKEAGEDGKSEEKAAEEQKVKSEEAAGNAGEVTAQEANDVTSSLRMFKIKAASVVKENDHLNVSIETENQRYSRIYIGSKNDADTLKDEKAIEGKENGEGYIFEFELPLSAADTQVAFVPYKKDSKEWVICSDGEYLLNIALQKTEDGKDDAQNPRQGGNSGENKPGTESSENQKEDESTNKTLPGGKYAIKEVTSNSSKFHVVSCELISANGEMYADITLNGTGYDYLYAGTADAAEKVKQEEWSCYKEDALGRYVYRVKVTSVDKGIAIAAHSIKKNTWYDRTLTFNTIGMTKAVEAEDGTYKVNVTSSSSMFKVTDCVLTSKNGKMTAKVTLSGTGYDYLYAGTSAKAAADSANWVKFVEDNGKYTYIIPVDALDAEIPVAAHSIKKNTWYDRTLVFSSTGVKKPGNNGPTNGNNGNNNTGNNTNQNNNSGTGNNSGNTGTNQTPDKESKYEADLNGGTARVNSATTLADGVYTPDKFSWSGGTGKVNISCTKITVTGGQAYATIVFSSGSYGYVKANGNTYYPTATGSTSTFVIPVELNKNNTIIGMTTKMSTAHEISYSIFIYLSAAAKADGTTVSGETNLSADTLDEKAPEIMGLSYQSETKVEHAEYFKIYHYDQGITLLEIDQKQKDAKEDSKSTESTDKKDTDSGLTPAQEEQLALYKAKIVRYLIVPEDAEIPAGLDKEMIVIQKPKKSVYVGSEEVLEILDKLNATDQITSVGVKQKNCKVESIAKAMKAKKIIYAGTYKKPDNKKLMKSKCDLVILSNKILPDEKNEKKMSVEDQQKRYEELAEKFVLLDVPMIVDRSVDEEKDDAKAEWSKVYEAIFAQTDSADSSAKN